MSIADTSEKGKGKIDGLVPFRSVDQVPPPKRGRPSKSKYDPVIEAAEQGSIVIRADGKADTLAGSLRDRIRLHGANVRVHVRGDEVYLVPVDTNYRYRVVVPASQIEAANEIVHGGKDAA